jgi:hypothetical protein
MRKLLLTTLLVAGVALLAWYPSQAQAQVSGACYLCHTMHNSQDGGIPTGGQATPQPHLTRSWLNPGRATCVNWKTPLNARS